MRFTGMLLITAGLLLSLWQLPFVRASADRVISSLISHFPNLMVIDFEELLNFDQGYTVAHLHVDHNKWMTDRTLRDLRLADEGVLVLNIQRASSAIIGTPAADTVLGAGDRILTDGRHECLGNLRNRPRDPRGEELRARSVEEQRELHADELAAEEKLAKGPPSAPERDLPSV